jgi:hypothetical protein
MRLRWTLFCVIGGLAVGLVAFTSAAQQEPRLDVEKISQAAGVKATVGQDGVVRIQWARTDVAVRVDGVPLPPPAGLVSWAAFKPTAQGAMIMGDQVVFEDEVSPAMDAAFAAGLAVTALHNHFVYDSPKVYFMHIAGTGDPERVAAAVKSIWEAVKKVRANRQQPAAQFPGGTPALGEIRAEPLETILGLRGQTQEGVVKFVVARQGRMHKQEIGGSMGLTTWMAFVGNDDLAVVDSDFIMTADEVQPVLRALRKGNVHVVALHNHMIGTEPEFYFAHFWGKGPPDGLARVLKGALDEQARASSGEH